MGFHVTVMMRGELGWPSLFRQAANINGGSDDGIDE
jgi:hypothetical protein